MSLFPLSVLQIDLGRQYETIEYLKHYLDSAKEWGYTAVGLYLEGRIRADVFPYPPEESSYSKDEMRELVAYAEKIGIELIPAFNILGHMDLFFYYPEIKKFAEVKETADTRFFTMPQAICPSSEEACKFIEDYLCEMAEIFPSNWMHIGCDEVWDLCMCEDCLKRLDAGESISDVFVKHIKRLHKLLTEKYGKRIMIWDDMLEFHPQALKDLPQDIVLCVWQYWPSINMLKNHFGTSTWDDRLRIYKENGFDFVLCPGGSFTNINNLTAHGLPYEPLGAWNTIWENSNRVPLDIYPYMVYAGKLWAQDSDTPDHAAAVAEVCKVLFNKDDAETIELIDWLFSTGFGGVGQGTAGFFSGPMAPAQIERRNSLRLMLPQFKDLLQTCTEELGKDILKAVLIRMITEKLILDMRETFGETSRWHPTTPITWSTAAQCALDNAIATLPALHSDAKTLWKKYRAGIEFNDQSHGLQGRVKGLKNFRDKTVPQLATADLIEFDYSLGDFYGAPSITWEVQYQGEDAWHTIKSRHQPKPGEDRGSNPFHYMLTQLVTDRDGRTPTHLRATVIGSGGVGLAHIRFRTHDGIFIPAEIVNINGCAETPNNLLINDTTVCWLGDPDNERAIHDPQATHEEHTLVIKLEAQ
jgi:hypothetical protein